MGKKKKEDKQILHEESPMSGKQMPYWRRNQLCPKCSVLFVLLFMAIVVPMTVFVLFLTEEEVLPFGTCQVHPDYRVECLASRNSTESECVQVGCCFDGTQQSSGAPHCYHSLPSEYNFILQPNSSSDRPVSIKSRKAYTPYQTESKMLYPHILPVTETHLRVLIVDDPAYKIPPSSMAIENTEFRVNYSPTEGDVFYLDVSRYDSGVMMMSTQFGAFIASDDYLEVSSLLPSTNVYGLGFILEPDRRKTALYNNHHTRRQYSSSSHPFYMCIEDAEHMHGVFLDNSSPLELQLLPSGLLTMRAMGGVFDFHIFAGPSPKDVVEQFVTHVGKPRMQPAWSLGVHACRSSDDPQEYLNFFKESQNSSLPIYYDSECIDEHVVGNRPFDMDVATETNIADAVTMLQQSGKKVVLSLPPHVLKDDLYDAYVSGAYNKTYVMMSQTEEFTGTYRGETVVYPDFHDSNTQEWMDNLIVRIVDQNISADGIVLIDNSPLNEDSSPCADDFPFFPLELEGSLSEGTICSTANQIRSQPHFKVHNKYALNHTVCISRAWERASSAERHMLVSESTFSGSGQWGGHQGNDYHATWTDMKRSLVEVLEMGLFGIPFSGAPLCGSLNSTDNATIDELEDLCLRWYTLGLTLPFARMTNRDGHILRDPTQLSGEVRSYIAQATQLRYSLLPYYYTQMYQATINGAPIVRPMFFDFLDDNATWSLDEQFMIGPSILAASIFLPRTDMMSIYLPTAPWYEFFSGEEISEPGNINILALASQITLLIRGGHIVPIQEPGDTVEETRYNNLTLIVALDCNNTRNICASGNLYMDDGLSNNNYFDIVEFVATNGRLDIQPVQSTFCNVRGNISTTINGVKVFGVGSVNNCTVATTTLIEDLPVVNGLLKIISINLDWCNGTTSITWDCY